MSDSPHKTLFIDCNSGGKTFSEIVRKSGISIVQHRDHFGPTKPGEEFHDDHDWLVQIGKIGWLIVTGDKRTIREPLFLEHLPKSRALVFLLCDMNGQTPEGKAQCVIDAFPKMQGLINGAEQPSVWIFEGTRVTIFDWKSRLHKYHVWGRIKKR